MSDGIKMEPLDQGPPAQRTGKQVFMDGEHFADATTEEYADFMVMALNAYAGKLEDQLATLFAGKAAEKTFERVIGLEGTAEDFANYHRIAKTSGPRVLTKKDIQ